MKTVSSKNKRKYRSYLPIKMKEPTITEHFMFAKIDIVKDATTKRLRG